MKLAIVGCFYPPIPQTTTAPLPTTVGTLPKSTPTGTPALTTTVVIPTTTTMILCTQQTGMNTPLSIKPTQVISNPSPIPTTPPGDINPTSTTPGLNYPTPSPQINVTFDQPATVTLIYLPTDRPNQPTNVDQFAVVFVFPNGTQLLPYTSQIPSTGTTTTPSGVPSETTTTPSGLPSETTTPSTSGLVLPSNVSPQVDLPPNFQVPQGTTVVITITSTKDEKNPTGVCIILCDFLSLTWIHIIN